MSDIKDIHSKFPNYREKQSSLFQDFEQIDSSSSRSYGGTGLGLSISKRLVELMAGAIGIDSQVNLGSNFYFYVELDQLTDIASDDPIQEDSTTSLIDADLSTLKILLVEDNLVNQMITKALLDKMSADVDVASNGLESLECMKAQAYDLVLMDCQMPVMDGYTATKQWRAIEIERALTPVTIIALTAHAMDGDKERCLQAGMDDYLVKPVKQLVLAQVLRDRAAVILGQ